MAVHAHYEAPGHNGWAVYYRGPRIIVTSQYVETTAGRLPVRLLDDVRQIHVSNHSARVTALATAAVELGLAAPLAAASGSVALICAGAAAAAGTGVGALVDERRNPRWMALRATCQGRRVELFQTASKREFGQVHRAVLRAVELDRDYRA
ncbi:DUF6232 family protein [Actinoplanes sp. RD1]|uniref:DUF6232 family protein n=1 Tax=Actinoplanes sp. RD1 TaxID=3064538 RepID=UPI002740BE3E|nr:DUF6232 family protein [Actinoplanes sp. RD1]